MHSAQNSKTHEDFDLKVVLATPDNDIPKYLDKVFDSKVLNEKEIVRRIGDFVYQYKKFARKPKGKKEYIKLLLVSLWIIRHRESLSDDGLLKVPAHSGKRPH